MERGEISLTSGEWEGKRASQEVLEEVNSGREIKKSSTVNSGIGEGSK